MSQRKGNDDTDFGIASFTGEAVPCSYRGQYGLHREPVFDGEDTDSPDAEMFDRSFKNRSLTDVYRRH